METDRNCAQNLIWDEKVLTTALAGGGSMLFERKTIQTVRNISKRRASMTLHFCFPANFECLAAADLSSSAAYWRLLNFGAVTENPGAGINQISCSRLPS
jgi:hypothetical protein